MFKLVREVRLAVVGFDSTPCLPDVLKSVREVRSATVRIGSIPWMQDDIESDREVCLAAVIDRFASPCVAIDRFAIPCMPDEIKLDRVECLGVFAVKPLHLTCLPYHVGPMC